ncbi:MAG: T9SS type A sorting domain-containing protein [Bacteroidetes bacterium]|nr:T9SS type A sorting domain-containing protein [Bacteroidota bacterium]
MSYSSNSQLDTLFAALRDDAPEPHENELAGLISREAVPVSPVGSTLSTNNQPKGTRIMTSSIIVLIASGLVYLGLQLGSGIAPKSIQNATSPSALFGQTDATASTTKPTVLPERGDAVAKPADTMHFIPFDRADIRYATPIEVSDKTLEALGITRRSDGAVLLFDGATYRTAFATDSIPASGEIRVGEPVPAVLPPFTLYPQFVTDMKGNLLMIAEHSSANGGQMSSQTLPAGIPSVMPKLSYYRTMSSMGTDGVIDSSTNPPTLVEKYRVTVGIVTLDTIVRYPYPDDRNTLRQITNAIVARLTVKDSTLKASYGGEDGLRARFGAPIPATRALQSPTDWMIAAKLDAAARSKHTELEQLQAQEDCIRALISDPTLSDTLKLRLEQIRRPLEYREYLLQHKADEARFAQINSLVPILVRKEHGRLLDSKYDDGLIFWYAPQTSLAQAVPELGSVQTSDVRLAEQESISGLVAYPNPAFMYLFASYSLTKNQPVTISLRDLLGREALPAVEAGATGSVNGKVQFDVSSLPTGMYLLVVETGDGRQRTRRIIIKHP